MENPSLGFKGVSTWKQTFIWNQPKIQNHPKEPCRLVVARERHMAHMGRGSGGVMLGVVPMCVVSHLTLSCKCHQHKFKTKNKTKTKG